MDIRHAILETPVTGSLDALRSVTLQPGRHRTGRAMNCGAVIDDAITRPWQKPVTAASDVAATCDAHALCRIHAERLVRKIGGLNERQRSRVSAVRDDIREDCREPEAYRRAPCGARAEALSERFDGIFSRRTGYAILDRLVCSANRH